MESLNCYSINDDGFDLEMDRKISSIAHFEKETGVKLSQDYLDFLLNYGGFGFDGYVDFPFLDYYPKDDRALINVFWGVGCKYDFFNAYYTYEQRIPPELIPIASDPGSNVICIAVSGNIQGKIYFWDHSEELIKQGDTYVQNDNNLYLVANSFDDFINSLEFYNDEEDE
jgi:hypothetical protein